MGALTTRLILAPVEWREVLAQRASRAGGQPMPVRWNTLLDRMVGGRLAPASLRTLFGPGLHFSWHLLTSTIIAALLGRPLVYLCWGVDYHRGVRRRIARMILRRARLVLVNDALTAAEVEHVAGVRSERIPYLVDTEFYTCQPVGQREDYLFCPGANDRDGEVLLGLAHRGHRVIWLNNLPELAARFAGRDDNLIQVSFPSFAELRDLYRRCRAVVLPLTRDIHAAGQTTTLEALASGCPVIVSRGRTAELFDGLVTVVDGSETAEWNEAISQAVAADHSDPTLPAARACHIAERHGVAAVSAALRQVFRTVDENRSG